MRRSIFIGMLLLSVFIAKDNFAQNFIWHRDFNKASEIAKKENKYILVDFYTDWCKWCKVMDEKTYSNPEVSNKMKKYFVAVKINPEKEGNVKFMGQSYTFAQFAQAAGVTGYPSTGLFTSNGEFITNITGYLDIPKFDGMLSYLLGGKYKQLSYEDYSLYIMVEAEYKKNQSSADLNFVMGFFNQVVLKDFNKAKSFYQAAVKSNSNFSEAFAGLSETYKLLGDNKSAEKNMKTAKSKGFSDGQNKIMNKVSEIVQKLFS